MLRLLIDLLSFFYRSQPCTELTPRLEKAVSAVQGIKLAKMNIDREADIAGQLRVDVLPTLFLIYEVGPLFPPSKDSAPALTCLVQGKVVEKISGTLTPQGVESLVAKALKLAGMKTQASHSETLIAAGKLLSQGEPDKAAALYAQATIPSPSSPPAPPSAPPPSVRLPSIPRPQHLRLVPSRA